MPSRHIRARPPRGDSPPPEVFTDPAVLDAFREDAAHFPGGHASGVAFPRDEAAIASLLHRFDRVLAVSAQSSLTGGATPMGDLVVSLRALDKVLHVAGGRARVQAGVPLVTLQQQLAQAGCYYPPAPTHDGAFVGGTIATNAAGAATFKYGATRAWVDSLTLVLTCGEVLDIERGQIRAEQSLFEIETASRGIVRVPVPSYRLPDVPKRSSGYFAEPGMDLIDLFIGAEGTLGIVTEATLRVVSPRPATCLVLLPLARDQAALSIVADLRDASRETWRTGDANGIDVAAVELLDRRSIELLREDGADRKQDVRIPESAGAVLLVQLDLPPDTGAVAAMDQIAAALDDAADGPLVRFCRLLDRYGLLDAAEIALPGDTKRAEQFAAIREAVPETVNRRVGEAKRTVDSRIEKTAADMIVPFDRFADMMALYRRGFCARGLDFAIWGHISDGNVHPNVIPRSFDDVRAGKEAILEFGREVALMGGCPLAEHGVGRNPVKQALLRQMVGDRGLEEMRAVKRALDPEWKLARGVLLTAP